MKPRLGLDLDGVLYPWHRALYNETLIYWDEERDYYTFWKEHRTYRNKMWWDNVVKLQHLYSNQLPDKECLDLLKELDKCYNIYYVTNRPEEVIFTTKYYLWKYGFPSHNQVVFTKDKVKSCNDLEIDFFVEDRIENIIPLLKNSTYTFIVHQPWNENYRIPYFCYTEIESFVDLKGYLL